MCRLNSEIEELNSSILKDRLLTALNHYNYNQKNHVNDYEYEDRENSQINDFM